MKSNWLILALLVVGVTLLGGCEKPAEETQQTASHSDGAHATVEVTADNFEALVNGDTPVLLDFWATWCGPCVALTPTLEELATEYDGKIIVGKVNVDEQEELARKFNISGIPALFYMKKGEVVGDQLGLQPRDALVKKIEEVIAM